MKFRTIMNLILHTTRTWTKGNKEAYMIQFDRFYVQHSIVRDIPLNQRLSMDFLNTLIQEELKEKGITTPCAYGVYSNQRDSFVLLNDVVKECGEQYTQPSNFKYKHSLYPYSNAQIGVLYVDFPAKRSF